MIDQLQAEEGLKKLADKIRKLEKTMESFKKNWTTERQMAECELNALKSAFALLTDTFTGTMKFDKKLRDYSWKS